MKFDETTKIAAQQRIPPDKLAGKAQKTIMGVGSILMGMSILVWFVPPLPAWVFGLFVAFGAYSISGDLVRGFAAFLPAVIRDVRAAIKGDS